MCGDGKGVNIQSSMQKMIQQMAMIQAELDKTKADNQKLPGLNGCILPTTDKPPESVVNQI